MPAVQRVRLPPLFIRPRTDADVAGAIAGELDVSTFEERAALSWEIADLMQALRQRAAKKRKARRSSC
jgi:hypothetical protein